MRLLQQVANIRRIIQLSLVALSAVAVGELSGQGFLVDTVRTGMVFDHAGQNLYISDGDGLIKTFNLQTHTFGRTYHLGGWLWGIDIAPDDSFILAAQANYTIFPAQAKFQRVNLATGAITDINYTPDVGGSWDVKIASNGLALATATGGGSGWTWLRQIDLSTNAVTNRSDAPGSGQYGQVTLGTQIYRSADGTRLLFMESDISSGPTFTYSATTNTFGPSFHTNAFRDWAGGAVSRNGNLVAETTGYRGTQASLFTAPSLHDLHDFTDNGLDGGLAFDAVHDVLYAVNTVTNQIIAYSTTTFAELFRFDVGESVGVPPITQFDTGTLVASADGRWLALETDSGIRLFTTPNTAVWYLNGNAFTTSASVRRVPPGWEVVGVADFNGDGYPDYLLFNTTTRATVIWYMHNDVHISGNAGPTIPAEWQLAAVADFNGDGHPDCVLFNPTTRATVIWYMHNNVHGSSNHGPTLPADWQLAAIADFNGDGHPDYLLLNPTTRATVIWYMHNNVHGSSNHGPTLPADWQLAAIADFDGDGHPDYLLFDASM